jgi:hypothetical protein
MAEIDYLAESRLRRRLHRRKHPDQRGLVIVTFDTCHNRRTVAAQPLTDDLPRSTGYGFFRREHRLAFNSAFLVMSC